MLNLSVYISDRYYLVGVVSFGYRNTYHKLHFFQYVGRDTMTNEKWQFPEILNFLGLIIKLKIRNIVFFQDEEHLFIMII